MSKNKKLEKLIGIQIEFAEKSKIPQQTLSSLVNDRNRVPKLSTVKKMAKALRVSEQKVWGIFN